jgi:beta-glucanase (GH16 family)
VTLSVTASSKDIMNSKLKILVLLLLFSCKSDEPKPAVLSPTDLVINVALSETISGQVSLIATANNVNYFNINFGVGDGFVLDEDGKLIFQYSESGEYEITVRAHATTDVFVETTTTVSVDIEVNTDISDEGYTTPLSYSGYNLVWQDEFSGTTLSSDWIFEIGTGNGGWGNNELQYYRQENTTVEDGYLIIEAKKEVFGGQNYTSSRIITKGNQSFQHGRIDIRAILPKGQGIWPALWMLGDNISTVGWPSSGEIDIMELIGGQGKDNTVYGTVHWDNAGSYASYGDHYSLPTGIFNDKFHVFSIVWDVDNIKWYMDDILFNTIDITPDELDEFQKSFFVIFNVAVGGNWPGSPDSSTQFPQKMVVDYIRIFQ